MSLTSELHEAIASHLDLENLLLLGSTCQQFHRLISAPESEAIWTQLYNTYWGTTAHPNGISARAAFKMRCAGVRSATMQQWCVGSVEWDASAGKLFVRVLTSV